MNLFDLKVVVYGTLRKGGRFAHVMPDPKFLVDMSTEKIEGFKMLDLGPFPGVFPGNDDDYIIGEVCHFRFNNEEEYDEALAKFDRLEGVRITPEFENVGLYRHGSAQTSMGEALIYIFNDEESLDMDKIYPTVYDWMRHLENKRKQMEAEA